MRINKKIIGDLANFIEMRYKISVTDTQEKYPELFKSFMRMQFWLDEIGLANYFAENENAEEDGTYWQQQLKWETRKTGQQLLDKIAEIQDNNSDELKILDVGCGDNEWKQHLGARLTGIDPFNSNADFNIGISEYAFDRKPEYDIILALGSINFGDQIEIEKQLSQVVNLVKPGGKIFFRFNPGITHGNAGAKWIDFFPYTEEFINDIATKLNCKVNELGWDHPKDSEVRWGNRYYSEWTKTVKFN